MKEIRIFISSVQSEFSKERLLLYDYINQDALLGQFFEPFIFEKSEAKGMPTQTVYLEQVKKCDTYIIFNI